MHAHLSPEPLVVDARLRRIEALQPRQGVVAAHEGRGGGTRQQFTAGRVHRRER
jgi:hypothetical protein